MTLFEFRQMVESSIMLNHLLVGVAIAIVTIAIIFAIEKHSPTK